MSRLAEIIDHKRQEIAPWINHTGDWERRAHGHRNYRSFRLALEMAPFGFIAEVKRASPSAGLIAAEFDPLAIATRYYEAGAHCISVLTDERFFQGHLDYLALVHQHIPLPTLRKDFMLHEVQIYQAILAGADAILLIVAALGNQELPHLLQISAKMGIDALVEVHDERELDRALHAGADFIGINNRNLATFEVDLATTELLAPKIPNDCTVVSESGIRTVSDVQRVANVGIDGVLVGEALMRAPEPQKLLRELQDAARHAAQRSSGVRGVAGVQERSQ
jgi:indole-3-glycerol phosphate synthase